MNTHPYIQKITTRTLIAYFLLAFGITWGLSVIATKDLLPFAIPPVVRNICAIVLHYGPAIAAIIMVGTAGGRSAVWNLLSKLGRWRVGIGWYLFVFLFPLLVHLAAVVIDVWMGGQWPVFMSTTGMPQGISPILLIPLVFLPVFLQAGLAEEIGWRGYALPGLQKRYSALVSSILLGVIWWLWHFHPFNFAAVWPTALPYLFGILAITILFTWIYNNTGGSLLLVALFHTWSNVCDWIVPTKMAVAEATTIRPSIIQSVLMWIVVIVIVLLFGAKQLSRKRQD